MEINEEKVVQPVVEQAVSTGAAEKPANNSHDKKNFHRRDDRRPGGRGPRRGGDRDKQFKDTVVSINRVSKTVKGGRRMRFSVLVAVGDGKGQVGFGTGKANEVPDAIKKATEAARKNVKRISIVKGDTIPHTIEGKYGACKVFLKPAPVGAGVIAGGPVRAVLELAGIKNIYSKVYGSRTAINIVRATIGGLTSLKTVTKVANLRGKSPKEIKY